MAPERTIAETSRQFRWGSRFAPRGDEPWAVYVDGPNRRGILQSARGRSTLDLSEIEGFVELIGQVPYGSRVMLPSGDEFLGADAVWLYTSFKAVLRYFELHDRRIAAGRPLRKFWPDPIPLICDECGHIVTDGTICQSTGEEHQEYKLLFADPDAVIGDPIPRAEYN